MGHHCQDEVSATSAGRPRGQGVPGEGPGHSRVEWKWRKPGPAAPPPLGHRTALQGHLPRPGAPASRVWISPAWELKPLAQDTRPRPPGSRAAGPQPTWGLSCPHTQPEPCRSWASVARGQPQSPERTPEAASGRGEEGTAGNPAPALTPRHREGGGTGGHQPTRPSTHPPANSWVEARKVSTCPGGWGWWAAALNVWTHQGPVPVLAHVLPATHSPGPSSPHGGWPQGGHHVSQQGRSHILHQDQGLRVLRKLPRQQA